MLFDLIKFLLQAIFSAMEEEHEDTVRSDDGEGVSTPTATTATVPPITGSEDIQDGACTTSRTGVYVIKIAWMQCNSILYCV